MKKRILVVEDNLTTAGMMQLQLELLGYQVKVVTNGLEAMEVAPSTRPDLIVLDMRMPKLNGFDTAKQLRQNAGTKDIPILAATAFANPGAREKCLASGCDGYISKPFDHHQLGNAIAKLLNDASPQKLDRRQGEDQTSGRQGARESDQERARWENKESDRERT
jgi:two-component system cell cycle response regulator DivK